MKVEVQFGEQKTLHAKFNQFQIVSDQSIKMGGGASAPEPFDYFLASMALCAGHYVKEFCSARGIDTEGIVITQHDEKDPNKPSKRCFNTSIELPDHFPEKYVKALQQTIKLCSVRKAIESQPTFEISVDKAYEDEYEFQPVARLGLTVLV